MIKLIYPKESYILMGLFFEVYNRLGPTGYQEKHYQRAIESQLRKNKIKFESQKKIVIKTNDQILGKFYLDLAVEINKKLIAVELKKTKFINFKDINQLYCYLKASGVRLGIIINFGCKGGLRYKRVINVK